jgi:hypothetical protein
MLELHGSTVASLDVEDELKEHAYIMYEIKCSRNHDESPYSTKNAKSSTIKLYNI